MTCTCYYSDDIIKTEDFDFDNILIAGKSYKSILFYQVSYKALIGSNHCTLDSIKEMNLLEFMVGLAI